MLSLEQCLDGVYKLPQKEKAEFMACFKTVSFPAKTLLIKEGEESKSIYFVARGSLRSYYGQKDKEVTLWFGHEGDLVTCFRSVIKGEKGLENIQLSEDCTFYEIAYDVLNKLTQQFPEINQFYRKLMEESYLYWENRVMMLLFYTAKERYTKLTERSPFVLQRFPLSQIASYLGITQETLSRIRAEK
ncbi:MAG TPA: Crp/Fnr family transcriptional regulator [Flavobacteriales bacterium]|nr:Crp/Fnr family transcriptional regulator [Flavobacteriales bacterium]